MVISMLKIRRPLGRLIFNMGIAIPGKTVFLCIEKALVVVVSVLTVTSYVDAISHLLFTWPADSWWSSQYIKMSSYRYRIPMLKIRQSHDRLILIWESPYLWNMVFFYWDRALSPASVWGRPTRTCNLFLWFMKKYCFFIKNTVGLVSMKSIDNKWALA